MVKDKGRFMFDILILIVIAVVIYYIKMQDGDMVSPADGIMSLIELNG